MDNDKPGTEEGQTMRCDGCDNFQRNVVKTARGNLCEECRK